jgi:hypothetical protein
MNESCRYDRRRGRGNVHRVIRSQDDESPLWVTCVTSLVTSDANGARDTGILRATAPESTNACSVMGTGIRNNSAKFPTSDAEQGECVASLTTTPEWPTPTVHQTSGPLDDGKDVNKGVMSQETLHA